MLERLVQPSNEQKSFHIQPKLKESGDQFPELEVSNFRKYCMDFITFMEVVFEHLELSINLKCELIKIRSKFK